MMPLGCRLGAVSALHSPLPFARLDAHLPCPNGRPTRDKLRATLGTRESRRCSNISGIVALARVTPAGLRGRVGERAQA
jgi:hypothetical protein